MSVGLSRDGDYSNYVTKKVGLILGIMGPICLLRMRVRLH